MIIYRITFYGEKGTTYSYIEKDEDEGDADHYLYEGDWTAPFPNNETDSLAYGLEEMLLQSDDCPPEFCNYACNEKIVRITVKKEN